MTLNHNEECEICHNSAAARRHIGFAGDGTHSARLFCRRKWRHICFPCPHDTRLDMLDYYEAGRKMPMGNNFGRNCRHRHLGFRLSAGAHIGKQPCEILLAASKRDTVIYVVTTYMLPAADSHVAAYNKNWEILNTSKYFKMPRIQDFIAIPKGDKTRRNDLAALAKIPTFECRINPADKSITVSPTVKGTMTVEDLRQIETIPCHTY